MAQLSFAQGLVLRRHLKEELRRPGQGLIEYIFHYNLFDDAFRSALPDTKEARFEAEFKAIYVWAQLYEKIESKKDFEAFGQTVALITFKTRLKKTKKTYSFGRAKKSLAQLSIGCSESFNSGLFSLFESGKRDDRDIVYGLEKLMSYLCSTEADQKARSVYSSINTASHELGVFLSHLVLRKFSSSSTACLFGVLGGLGDICGLFSIPSPKPIAEVSSSPHVRFFTSGERDVSGAGSGLSKYSSLRK